MNVSKLESKINHVSYTYIENNSNTICFMLSGSGYTYEKPLFYYATMKMIENGYDIVQLHYSYDMSYFKTNIEELMNRIITDVDAVIDEVLAAKQYEKILFIGKSLGTLPISFNYSKNKSFQNAKLVLLTPLLQVDDFHEKIMGSTNDMLMIIGTEDGNFINEKIAALRNKSNLNLIEINGANHSLDIVPTNTLESLKIMTKMIEEMQHFVSND